jgi:methenyltetrahydrofolate cyclohydrolase
VSQPSPAEDIPFAAEPGSYLGLTLQDWLAELAAPVPVAGAGAALGYAVASAAAVLAFAAEASRETWDAAAGALAQADVLCERAAPLAQHDAEALSAAHRIRRAARDDPPEVRDRAIGAAFARAAEPPLEIARVATDVVLLARELAVNGAPAIHADALAAAALAAGVARGAASLVAVNLTVTPGDSRNTEARLLADVSTATLATIEHTADEPPER